MILITFIGWVSEVDEKEFSFKPLHDAHVPFFVLSGNCADLAAPFEEVNESLVDQLLFAFLPRQQNFGFDFRVDLHWNPRQPGVAVIMVHKKAFNVLADGHNL
jgi:hypothetical protein